MEPINKNRGQCKNCPFLFVLLLSCLSHANSVRFDNETNETIKALVHLNNNTVLSRVLTPHAKTITIDFNDHCATGLRAIGQTGAIKGKTVTVSTQNPQPNMCYSYQITITTDTKNDLIINQSVIPNSAKPIPQQIQPSLPAQPKAAPAVPAAAPAQQPPSQPQQPAAVPQQKPAPTPTPQQKPAAPPVK